MNARVSTDVTILMVIMAVIIIDLILVATLSLIE